VPTKNATSVKESLIGYLAGCPLSDDWKGEGERDAGVTRSLINPSSIEDSSVELKRQKAAASLQTKESLYGQSSLRSERNEAPPTNSWPRTTYRSVNPGER